MSVDDRESFLEAYSSSTTHVNSLEVDKKLPEMPSDTDLRSVELGSSSNNNNHDVTKGAADSLAPRKNLAELQTWLTNALETAESAATSSGGGSGVGGGQMKLALINLNRSFRASNADIDYCIGTMLGTLHIPSDAFTREDVVKSCLFPPGMDTTQTLVSSPDDDNEAVAVRSIACNTSGVAWKYFPRSCTTIGVIWALDNEGRGEVEAILHFLRQAQPMLYHPLLLSMLVLQALATSMRHWVAREKRQLEDVQIASGFHSFAEIESKPMKNSGIDFSQMTAEVIGKAAKMKTSEVCLRGLHDLATSILEQNASFTRSNTKTTASHENQRKAVADFVQRHTAFWAGECDFMIREAVAWQTNATIIVQGLFNLIAQRDQQTSIALAHDSKILAEQSTHIADETRALALATKRDSTSMKAIAAVTMMFLPGTFVASVLSMPIFVLDERSNTIVNHQFWLYWAVTIPLTLFTVSAWLVWDCLSNDPRPAPWGMITQRLVRLSDEKD